MNPSPLGLFDSGVGGLTVVRAVQDLLPAEDILYLGDTARLPYGSKSPETIRRFADEDARFLIRRGVKAIVVACNTATAHALPQLRERYRLPVIGVIEAGVDAALEGNAAERVGIIATRGTIRSHAYQHALAQRSTGLIIHGQATPLLVPLIEEDWLDHPATKQILQSYLGPLVEKGIDTLMLACTHYPLLVPVLRELLPAEVRLVDSATTCAEHLRRELQRLDILAPTEREGRLEIHLTDLSEEFEDAGAEVFKKNPRENPPCDIGPLTLEVYPCNNQGFCDRLPWSMTEKTLFQKICDHEIPAQLVHEDDLCVAFHDISPQAPVHVLVVPRKPIPRIGAAQPEDASLLGHLLLIAGTVAHKLGIADSGFRVVINHGRDGGETVPHLHVHLLGGRPLDWPPG